MNTGDSRTTINRRTLLASLALAGLLPRLVVAHDTPWRPEDGLRLAGPVNGLASLDPALSRDNPTNVLVRQVTRGLIGYDAELLPVPELAASVDVGEGNTVYTFTLRDDARFHDGRNVEAEDVAFSLSRALHPATSEASGMPLVGTTFLGDIAGADDVRTGNAETLSGIEALDDRTVRITLDGPSTTFLMRLASIPAAILDRHQDMSDPGWWTSLNGSGPYRVDSVDPASTLSLRAVDAWLGSELPVREVEVRLGLSASAPENLLQGSEIDLLDNVYPGMVPLLVDPALGMESYQLFDEEQFAFSYVAFGGREEPLDDIHIRRAIQRGFDVPGFVAAALGDNAVVPDGVIPQGVLGRAWRADMPAYDLDAARAEIAASRYGSAEEVPPIRIHAADIAPVEALRTAMARDLGLRIEAIQVNWDDFLAGLSGRLWDAYSVYWSMDYPDPEALLRMLWASGSADNYTGYSNDAFDAALDESRRAENDIQRHDLYMEAQQMLIDDVAVVPLYMPRRFTMARPGFSHVPVTPIGLIGLEHVR